MRVVSTASLPVLGLFTAMAAASHAAEVSVAAEGKQYRVRTPVYEAVVAADGGLDSLRVNGVEFLPPVGSVARGTYFYQGGVLALPDIRQPEPTILVAGSEKASVRYEFGRDTFTWTLANTTTKGVEYVLLLDSAVAAVCDPTGSYWKPPVESAWTDTTWFRQGVKLRVQGSTKLWGPFAANLQVWIGAVGPNQTHKVTLTCEAATADEVNKAAAAVPRPRPPKPEEVKEFSRVSFGKSEAVIATDGCLTSLRVNGSEFFRAGHGNPRGAYLYQGGPLQLPNVARPADNVVTASGDKASARYEFSADRFTWAVTNPTAENLLCLIAFDPGVNAVQGEHNWWARPPVSFTWQTSTWYRDQSSLRIEGSSKVWGPWGGEKLQIWEATVGPKATSTISFQINPATAADLVKATEVAARPPPPPPTDPKGPMWDVAALSKPPATYPAADVPAEPGVKALFYEGLPFQDRPTRVFAWVGLPKDVQPGQKVPGMVLVHGGGGTAFANWVRLWTDRGYAAISMDTCGCLPGGDHGHRPRHGFGGPPGWGGWDQIDWPREDQWTYHAVADAILGHSLLRSLPEVDPERVGLTGISWGGYLTCIIAGVDHRFRFAVPVYGCGYTNEHGFAGSVSGLGQERADRWMRWWDPSVYLKDMTAPMLWVTGSNDFAYTFNSLQKSYRLPPGPRTLAIRLRMPHGHGPAGEAPKEIQVFADSLLKGGQPLAQITGQGRDGRQVWATFTAPVAIAKAELNVTKDTGKWQDRKWEALPAALAEGRATAELPEGTKVYYLNLFDTRDCVVSTEHEDVDL